MAQNPNNNNNKPTTSDIDIVKSWTVLSKSNGMVFRTIHVDGLCIRIFLVSHEGTDEIVNMECMNTHGEEIDVSKSVSFDNSELCTLLADKNRRNYDKLFNLLQEALNTSEIQELNEKRQIADDKQMAYNQQVQQERNRAQTWIDRMSLTAKECTYLPTLYNDYEDIIRYYENIIKNRKLALSQDSNIKNIQSETLNIIINSEKDNKLFENNKNKNKNKNKNNRSKNGDNGTTSRARERITGKKRSTREFAEDLPDFKRLRHSIINEPGEREEKEGESDVEDDNDNNKQKHKNKEKEQEKENVSDDNNNNDSQKPRINVKQNINNNNNSKNLSIMNFQSPVRSETIVSNNNNNNNGNDTADE